MSWLFSQALVAEYSAANCSDGAQSALSSGNPIPQAYCASDKMTAFSRLSRFGMTFAPLTDTLGADVLTWFLAGFPARTSVQQERVRESTESGAECGAKWPALLARFDPDTRSWRTHQCLLFEDSTECLETFPRSGMMRGGELWELSMSAHLTRETVSGLLPTPDANCGARGGTTKRGNRPSGATRQVSINDVVKMWPTPTAHNAKETNAPSEVNGNEPTLASRVGGQLNPTWVEWLMGWPLGWTDLKPLVTDKFQQWLNSHGEF